MAPCCQGIGDGIRDMSSSFCSAFSLFVFDLSYKAYVILAEKMLCIKSKDE